GPLLRTVRLGAATAWPLLEASFSKSLTRLHAETQSACKPGPASRAGSFFLPKSVMIRAGLQFAPAHQILPFRRKVHGFPRVTLASAPFRAALISSARRRKRSWLS